MKHVIFAHSHCTDGLCAASIIKRAINICLNTEDIVVIFARYGAEKKALEQAEIDEKTDVYIVDFSFSRSDTLDIAKKCKNLVMERPLRGASNVPLAKYHAIPSGAPRWFGHLAPGSAI